MTTAILLLTAASATAASGPNIPIPHVTQTLRAIGYPRPHPKRLVCKGRGAIFRCVATYPRNRRRVFYATGRGEGGWICAGARVSRCRLLARAFVTTAEITNPHSGVLMLDLFATEAADGYVTNHYGARYSSSGLGCSAAVGTLAFSCVFPTVTVVITFTPVKGGYVFRGTG